MRRRDSSRTQAGQAIIIVALMMAVLIAGVGLAVDAGLGYYYNAAASRAAAAAALSGVIFMPNQFSHAQASPAGSGNDATDRAVAEAKRNRFDVADPAVSVTPAAVSGATNQLQVTVSRTVTTFFMRMFGVSSFPVSRVAVAEYLSPISLGQPGNQTGSTVSQLGTGNNYYFMREFGWSADRLQGDAFSPNPAYENGAALIPASLDVHQISRQAGSDTVDASLPARGGYNYLVNLPAGGDVQVYNAAFAPDGNNGGVHNYCENNRLGSPLLPIGPCSLGGNYYLHEEDSVDFNNPATFNAMEYTLFKVSNAFIRSSDVEIAQMVVLPIDASAWDQSKKQYSTIVTGKNITQSYNPNGSPSNMLIYHNWIDVASYTGSGDGKLVTRTSSASSPLPAGTYRLRVDSLAFDGTNPPDDGVAHKGYAVRAVDASGNPCPTCSVGAMNDMVYYTPISTVGGGSFTIPLLQLSPGYAGETITVDVYDPGDIGGGGNVDINVLDPGGAVAAPTPPATVTVTDLGVSRSFIGTPPSLIANSPKATFRATSSGTTLFNGHWVEMRIPVPNMYNPGPTPSGWYWSLQYVTSSGVTATDTVTVAVGLAGNPAHLLTS